jgi:predicted O-methyltransferase YrrM
MAKASRPLASGVGSDLPAISVSPNQGKLPYLLAHLDGARLILEIGTLGGAPVL